MINKVNFEKKSYIRKKDRIISFLKNRKITMPIYYGLRFGYLVLRKIKYKLRMLGKDINFKNRFYIINDKIDRIEEKIFSTIQQVETFNNASVIEKIKSEANFDLIKLNDSYDELKKSNEKFYYYENKIIGRVKSILFYHGGSGNHGCEALIKTITKLGKIDRNGSVACSYVMKEDYKYYIDEIIEYILDSNQDTKELDYLLFSKDAIAYSIGGDNYCGYDYGTKKLEKYNTFFNDRRIKTALIGCSIEPSVLEHQEVLDDLHNYSLITARESITYNALLKKGMKRNTYLIPDSAFILEPILLPLPRGFEEYNTIGINISNLVQSYDKEENLTYLNYVNLIKYLIDNTKYQIALIPHVVQDHNDDLKSLEKLYDQFKEHYDRIILINEHNCNEIKGFIKRCKMLVCTRTHASIAGYSSMVPTLVLGYSVKSKGIAKDIFGRYENYVVSVDSLKSHNDLTKSFIWFDKNYSKIKKHLEDVIPNYINNCNKLTEVIDELRIKKYDIKKLPNDYKCTGCMTCFNVCPQNCINIRENINGFIAPRVDYNKCIDCNICRERCPVNNKKIPNYNAKFYAVINKDNEIRKKSTSGGIFYLLAKKIINEKGIVFGASMDENNQLIHISIKKLSDIDKITKSKYIQSSLGDTFSECKKYLEKNIKVLFCATPCQIAGLQSFLGKDYKNLICIDFVCHGVPSQKEFNKHLKYLEGKYGKKVKKFDFRDKSESWMEYKIKVTFDDGTSIFTSRAEDEYVHNFLSNINLRDCCYICQFNNFRNYSDITIGDLWGTKMKLPEMFDDKGTSLVIINTKKGEKIFEEITEEVKYKSISHEIAIYNNFSILNHNEIPIARDKYFNKNS